MKTDAAMTTRIDRDCLQRCVTLAEQALDAGDAPFGSVLAHADGRIIAQERNRVGGGDATQHPEFALARWAANNLSPAERLQSTVYTSGEHCPMCAAAHAWVGLGRIIFASSTQQLLMWLDAWGIARPPINPLGINAIAPNIEIIGPVTEFANEVKQLHRRYHKIVG